MSNCRNHPTSYCGSFIFPWIGVIRTLGLNDPAVWAAIYFHSNEVNEMIQHMSYIFEHTHQCFALLHIFFSEQELAVQVRQVYGVKIQKSDISESSQDDVFHCRRHVSVVRNPSKSKMTTIQSSHPIPPAPTNSTVVSDSRACSSAPSIDLACAVRACAVDILCLGCVLGRGYLMRDSSQYLTGRDGRVNEVPDASVTAIRQVTQLTVSRNTFTGVCMQNPTCSHIKHIIVIRVGVAILSVLVYPKFSHCCCNQGHSNTD